MGIDDEDELAKTVAVADWQAELGGLPIDPPATGGATTGGEDEEMHATIALADGAQAEEIRRKLDELELKMPGGGPPKVAHKPTVRSIQPPQEKAAPAAPNVGEIDIPGPRGTGVLLAIASLSTLCLMGVGALLYNRVNPLRPPAAATATSAPAAATAAPTGSAAP